MDLAKAAQDAILKHLKPVLKPLLLDLAKDVVFVALKEAAAKTATPIDDSIIAIAEPIIEKAIDDMNV